MNAPAAIRGTFSDFRLVKTRKLAQIVIEVPIEEADAALNVLGGLPRSDNERWVAIARLGDERPSPTPAEPKERRVFCDLAMPTQAALKSNDEAFASYMGATAGDSCADLIRRWCEVDSRSKILPGTHAGRQWTELLRQYETRY